MTTIHGMTLENLDRIGVSDNGDLYWDNKPVTTEHRLNWVERVMAGGASGAAVLIAIIEAGRTWWGWGARTWSLSRCAKIATKY